MCLGGGAKTSCQRVLWTDGSASYGQMGLQSLFPCYLGKITECGTSEHRGLDPKRLILLGMDGSYYGLGLLSSWRYPVASRRDGG